MPTYEYACKGCGEHLEVVQSFKDDALTECPACGGTLRKVFSAAGIIFKGSGWHIKDYAASSKSGSSGSASDERSSSDSAGDSSSGSSASDSGSSSGASEAGSGTAKTGSNDRGGSSDNAPAAKGAATSSSKDAGTTSAKKSA
jgi:putative FmdB family regulatory protein